MYKKAFELAYKNKKVEIEIQDFVGDVRNINGTEDLFSLSYISDSKDKGQSILVTEADINFYADDYFNIDELKTVGETDIKVKYYEYDTLLWSGFVIPDFFSTSVDIAPVVSMVATDRIGTLKEISNNAESNIPIQFLASCLKQTGQDLPINLIIDNNHFETPIQLERIEEIASYDVIRTFMVLFNCKITLYKNAWWVVNKKLLESGFVNYKSYNSDGAGGSVTPFAQPILDIDLVDRDGQREIKPTASEISLFLEFGGSKKYPDNWNFEKLNKTAKLFDSWSNHAGFEQGWRDKRILFYVYASGYYNAWFSDEATEKISLWYKFYWYNNKISDNILDYPNLRSEFVKVPTDTGIIEISLNGSFTTRDGNPVLIMPIIHNKTTGKYYTYNRDGEIASAGNGSLNFDLSKIDFIHNPRTSTEDGFNFSDLTHEAVNINWDIKNKFNVSDFGSDTDKLESQIIFIGGVYLQGALDLGIDIFINSVQISFNDSQVTGKGLIFKIKQGGEKFSKSRETETILFSDKINQGVNGHFYNYKYDDTSIVDLPSEFALTSVRERADMFSKARDYYSLDGDFIVNPLAKYTCGLKSFVLVGGENRREDAGIIVEEIVSNALNRTDFIYTYFDDGKDKVKTIGTASGGSSSGGGGGSSPSTPQLIKEDENGNYYSEQPFYSLGGLSAFGFSEVGGGTGEGGIINVIDNLTSTSKTDPLSANQGRYLKTLIDNIKVGEGGQVLVDWEAITGKPSTFVPSAHSHIIGDVTGLQSALDGKASLTQLDDKEDKFTKNSGFNKNFGTGLNDVARGNHTHTFASLTSKPTTLGGYGITDGAKSADLASHISDVTNPHSVTKAQIGLSNVTNDKQAKEVHTHAISDVTNLQTALNSKLETSIFNTHNNDNIRHITGVERTKWDKVVTDFAGLEIGGRNYAYIVDDSIWGPYIVVSKDFPRNEKQQMSLSLWGNFEAYADVNPFYEIFFGGNYDSRFYGYKYTRKSVNHIVYEGGYIDLSQEEDEELVLSLEGMYEEGHENLITKAKIETGNKATDWAPAPEDQVSDWLTTDVNSFSFIKNKPTKLSQFTDNIGVASHIANKANPHSVTKAQVGLSNVDNAKQATKVEFDLFKSAYDEMFRKVGTSIEAKLPLYSLGGLSAYGFSDEGSSSGGGIVNILPSWESYDTSKSGWALSAGLGENLRTRVVTLENAEIDLSAYATLNYVNDKVKTNVPLNAKFTDTIVDISGKVDKVAGKGLSTNDFTTVEKNKLAILENQTRESLGVENVTNESKLTMFTNPTFTGRTIADSFEANSLNIEGASTFYDLVTMIDGLRVFGTTGATILEVGTNWKVLKTGNELEFQYNNVKKATLTPNGDLIVTGGMTAYQ